MMSSNRGGRFGGKTGPIRRNNWNTPNMRFKGGYGDKFQNKPRDQMQAGNRHLRFENNNVAAGNEERKIFNGPNNNNSVPQRTNFGGGFMNNSANRQNMNGQGQNGFVPYGSRTNNWFQ